MHIINLKISNIWVWLCGLFQPPLVDLAPPPKEALVPASVEPLKAKRERRDTSEHAKGVEEAGRWYFKRDILDRLDQYFHYLRRLKEHDRNAYDLYSRVGGYINNTHEGLWASRTGETQIDSSWRVDGKLPSFGCVTFPEAADKDADVVKDVVTVKLLYFEKVERSYFVEPNNDDVFRVTGFYAEKKDPKLNYPMVFYVAVDKENKPRVLRELQVTQQRLPPPKVKARKYGAQHITRVSWGLSQGLISSAAESWRPNGWSPQKQGIFIFSVIANTHANASADIQIRIEKGDLAALFCVDILRTPYFFSERETGLAADGRRKRIFHIVRPHKREHQDGSHSFVKSHFRGERAFLWNGYKVNITMPGFHHEMLNKFTSGFTDEEMLNSRRGTMTTAQLGDAIADIMVAS